LSLPLSLSHVKDVHCCLFVLMKWVIVVVNGSHGCWCVSLGKQPSFKHLFKGYTVHAGRSHTHTHTHTHTHSHRHSYTRTRTRTHAHTRTQTHTRTHTHTHTHTHSHRVVYFTISGKGAWKDWKEFTAAITHKNKAKFTLDGNNWCTRKTFRFKSSQTARGRSTLSDLFL